MKTNSSSNKNSTVKNIFTSVLTLALIAILFVQNANAVGGVTVTGSGGSANATYGTLKAAFDALNLVTTQAGNNIVITISASTTETATALLNQPSVSSWASLTIYPTATGLTISTAVSGSLIILAGADKVTIDGRLNGTGSAVDLTLVNSTQNVITLRTGATYNTIKYCNLKGSDANNYSEGVIHFKPWDVNTPNSNNIIEYNNITNGGTRLSYAISSNGMATSVNAVNTIRFNNIYDWGNPAGNIYGIYCQNYNSGWTIQGNSFYETTSLNVTAATPLSFKFIVAVGNGENFVISGNYMGGTAPNCGGTPLTKSGGNRMDLQGIDLEYTGTGTTEIQGNTIQNIAWSSTTYSNIRGMIIGGTGNSNIGTTTGNIIGASSGNNSIVFTNSDVLGDFMGMSLNKGTIDCANNIIGAIQTANTNSSNANNFRGIYIGLTTAATVSVRNNTIGSTDAGTTNSINASSAASSNSQSVVGIHSYPIDGSVVTISGNTISKMVNATTNTTGETVGITLLRGTNTATNNSIHDLVVGNCNAAYANAGIRLNFVATTAQTITGNTIYNISNPNSDFTYIINGIFCSGGTIASTISGNFIHSLSVNAGSNGASLYGININGGSTTVSNNIISLGGNTKTIIYGIYESGSAGNNNNLYFNTIYLSGVPTSGSFQSYALYSNNYGNTRNFRNNIFYNARSNNGATGKHYALYHSNYVSTGLTEDYNDYYVSGTNGMLGFNSSDKSTLASLQSATGQDAGSLNTNPGFVSAGGTNAADYIPGTLLPGTPVATYTTDYAGTTRDATPTIGAYEAEIPQSPTITSFTPTSTGTGQTVTITGTNFTAVATVSFGGTAAASFDVLSTTSITATVASGTSGIVSVTTAGGTATSTGFTFVAAPTITSFTPTSGGNGTTVTITGTNFTGVTAVSFGGTAATSFAFVSATSITAVVASGTTGSVSVTTPGGTASLAGFTYIPAPTITSFTPASGTVGTMVTITGTNFTGATGVKFGGTDASTYTVVSATSITADVAAGTTGTITVTSPGGTATSAGTFTVTVPPTFVKTGASGSNNGTNWANAYTDLQSALTSLSGGGTIWVAAGTYKPGNGSPTRSSTFDLPSGIIIYGGFAGSEVSESERAIAANPTVLSGDIGTASVTTDNVYHVVSSSGTATLDGVTITAGRADGAGANENTGGAVFFRLGTLTIKNSQLTSNYCSFSGGAIFINSGATSLALTNCLVTGNTSNSYAGAVGINAGATFTNCTFSSNSAYDGGAFYVGAPTTMNNSILWGNTATTASQAEIGSSLTLNYSCYSNSANDISGSVTPSNNITTDPQFVGSGDYSILGASPCADAGNDSYNTEAYDIRGAGFSRKLNKTTGAAGTIDMGAYELAPPPTITSLSPTSAGSGATVTITGTNFTGATAVSFGGTAATSFTLVDATSITAVVASGTSGSVSVTTPGGTATLTGFTFIACSNPTSGGTISAAQTICSGFVPAAFTSSAAASGNIGTLEYKWQLSTTSSVTGFSDIATSNSATYAPGALSATSWFKRLARVNCMADWTGAVASNVLQITVNQPSFSPGTFTVANLQATGSNIQWYAASSGGTALATSTALVNGTHYYASQTVNGVESTDRYDATATILQTPCPPTATTPQSPGAGTTVAALSATGQSIRWYTVSIGGTALPVTTPLLSGTHTYYASQTVSCTESASRVAVVVTLP